MRIILKSNGKKTANHRENCGDGGSNDHDLAFVPAAFFKMMMDGCHFEDAFFEKLIRADLQNNGNGFDDIDKSYKDDEKRILAKESQSRYHAAEKERTRIAHENAGGIPVINEKADHGTEQYARKI